MGVGEVVCQIKKHLRPTAIGTDVEKSEQTLGVQPDVLVQQREGTEPHDKYEGSFEEFEGGHGPEHAPLAAVRI
jgi:hypothetical protein